MYKYVLDSVKGQYQDTIDVLNRNLSHLDSTLSSRESQMKNIDKDRKQLNDSINKLNKDIRRLNSEAQNATEANKELALLMEDPSFARVILLTPITSKYDKQKVDKSLKLIHNLSGQKEFRSYADIYEPLIKDYGTYNDDLIQIIERHINMLKSGDSSTNESIRKIAKDINNSKYYKVRDESAGKVIPFLEQVIEAIQAICDNPAQYNEGNLEKQCNRLKAR